MMPRAARRRRDAGQFERLTVDVLVPRAVLRAARRATDPRAPLSTHEECCWQEAAVGHCLRRGAFAIQSVCTADEAP